MRRSSPTPAVLASLTAVMLLSSLDLFAQAKPQAAGNAAPRAANARDLEGIWGFATLTPLQRPKEFAGKEILTAEERAKLEDQAVRDQFVDRPAPAGNPGT